MSVSSQNWLGYYGQVYRHRIDLQLGGMKDCFGVLPTVYLSVIYYLDDCFCLLGLNGLINLGGLFVLAGFSIYILLGFWVTSIMLTELSLKTTTPVYLLYFAYCT